MPTTKFEKRIYKMSESLFHLCYPTPEEPNSMIHDLKINKKLLKNLNPDKVKLALFHSPVLMENPEVASYFEEFDYTIHGHMHNGCIPPVMYEMFHSTRGLIAPNKKLFPKNERNTLKKKQDKMIVNGPITVFTESQGFMQKFNFLFPTYTSTIEFTNNEEYNTEKVYVKRKYHK